MIEKIEMKIESTRKKALHLARFESTTSKILAGTLTTALLQPLPKLNNILPSTLRTKESQTGSFFKVWTELEKKFGTTKTGFVRKVPISPKHPRKQSRFFSFRNKRKISGWLLKSAFLLFLFFLLIGGEFRTSSSDLLFRKVSFFSAGHRTSNLLVNHFFALHWYWLHHWLHKYLICIPLHFT